MGRHLDQMEFQLRHWSWIETTVGLFYPLFNKIWCKEQIPNEWKEGYLIQLPQKVGNCNNYRVIMLLSLPGKVLSRILLNRMKGKVDPDLRDQQAGFRKDRSCTDQKSTLRIILEQSAEWNSSIYISFIDYEKAFDSVDREAIWKLLRHYGVPLKMVNIIKSSYQGFKCMIIHGCKLRESLEVKTGVKQGCLLSPFLFLLAIDWIMKTLTNRTRNGKSGHHGLIWKISNLLMIWPFYPIHTNKCKIRST